MVWKSRYWVYLLLFAMTAINYIDRLVLSVSAGTIKADLGIDDIQLGYLFSSFLWGYTLCLIPVGLLVDRHGARVVAGIAMAIWSGATVLTGAVSSIVGLMLARIVMGAGEAACYPAEARIVREWAPASERAFAMTLANAGAYFGPAIGALVLAWFVSAFGWRWSFVACGSLGFVWLALWVSYFRKPEEAKWLGEAERKLICGSRETAIQAQASSGTPSGLRQLLGSMTMWGLMLTQGAGAFTQYLFLTWLPNYLQAERGMTLMKSGAAMAWPYLGSMVIAVALGWLSDRLLNSDGLQSGRRRLLIGAIFLSGAVILLIPFVSSVLVILLLITVALGSVSAGNALNMTLLNDLLICKNDLGRAMGLLLLGGNLFGILAPIVTGYIVAVTGRFDVAFAGAGALLVVGAFSSWFLTRRCIDTNSDVSAFLSARA